jgi:hypothetical protein
MTSNIQPRLRQYSSALAIYVGKSTGGLAYNTLRCGRLPLLIHMHIWDLQGAHIWGHVQYYQVRRNLYLYISNLYLYISTKVLRTTSGRRTPRRAADGRTPRREADGGGAILRIGIHACAMGEGRLRKEPQRGGRERYIKNLNT